MKKRSRKINRIIALLFAAIAVSGCGTSHTRERDGAADEQPEVLMLEECGFDGLKCCATEPACTHGQKCCVNPANPEENRCLDDCACGKKDNFCCAGSVCDSGLACVENTCLPCGKENEPCCRTEKEGEGGACLNNQKEENNLLGCFNGKCVPCGRTGNPCCKENKCVTEGSMDKARSECQAGVCVLCGQEEQPACLEDKPCFSGYPLNNSLCYKCGSLNLPCCEEKEKESACGQGLNCRLGFCQ